MQGGLRPQTRWRRRGSEWIQAQKEAAEATLESATAGAEEAGGDSESHREVGRPARTIVKYADEEGFDHSSSGATVGRATPGSCWAAVPGRSSGGAGAGGGPAVTRLGVKPVRASDIQQGPQPI